MKSDLYDFEAGQWEFEWSTPAKVYPGVCRGLPRGRKSTRSTSR